MRPGPLTFALALLACHPNASDPPAPATPPLATPTSPDPATLDPAGTPSLVLPDPLPPILPEPPAPTAALPPGTPEPPGAIIQLVAVDEQRAIVAFIIPGPDHAKKWWLALMRRDGSIAWVQTLAGELAAGEGSTGIEIVGDAVSVMTAERRGDDSGLELKAFALADGKRRFTTRLGRGYATTSASHEGLRFDVRADYGSLRGGKPVAELVASSGARVEWRAKVPFPPPPGSDPTIIGDAIAVRGEPSRGSLEWAVFERRSGKRRGAIAAHPQSCSDGTHWFLLTAEGLVSVDPATLRTRLVTGPVTRPELPGTWALDDCVVAGDALVVLVSRGDRKAWVAFDPESFAGRGHAELGLVSLGTDGFDPMPAHAHAAILSPVWRENRTQELLIGDPVAGRPFERWRVADETSSIPYRMFPWRDGYVVQTRRMLAAVDGRTGALAGHAMLPEDAQVSPEHVGGEMLWVAPSAPMRLGARAPRLVELATAVPDDVRGAVLADLRPATAVGMDGKPPCPDPAAPLVGDGKGTDGTRGKLARTRLPTWDLDILYESARSLACAPGTAPARLMAWYVMEDERPLRNDNALLLVEDHSVEPPRFTLVQVYRHASNREWNVNHSSHSPSEPVRTFDHRPTRDDVDVFLAQSEWHFADDWGRVLAGNVLDAEWRAATHLDPWRSYPKGIEQPD